MNLRNALYFLAQLVGDINSAKRGRVMKRVQRRALGRFTGKHLMRRIVKRK
jgi:hypothetical protein